MSALDQQAEMFANRLRKKARKLAPWAKRKGLEAYRIYDRDIPEIPLVVDRYLDRLYIAVYQREPPFDDESVRVLAAAATEALGAKAAAVKTRERQTEGAQYASSAASERFVVQEGALKFYVELEGHLDTGLFLDHRETRALVGAASSGKDVLNLYAYTGSFGCYALHGGARTLTHVDLSKTYTRWAHDNVLLNELDGGRCEWIVDDTIPFLDECRRTRRTFHLVVVDPPTFSRSKRMEESFDVRRDHSALLRAVREVLAPGGTAWFSTNARGFQLDEGLPFSAVERMDEQTVPFDFTGRHAHRAWRLLV